MRRSTPGASSPHEKQRAGKTAGRFSALFIFAQFGLPLLSISLFARRFEFPIETVFHHELLVVLGYSVLLGLVIAAGLRPAPCGSRRPARYALALLWGGFTVALYFAHLFAWVGHQALGMNLTPSMVAPYVLHPSVVFSTLPITPLAFWSVLVVIPLALLLGYAVAAPFPRRCARAFPGAPRHPAAPAIHPGSKIRP